MLSAVVMRTGRHPLQKCQPGPFASLIGGLAACALLAFPAPARAAQILFRAKNQDLEQAKKLASNARYGEALDELVTAQSLPGNTNRQLAELFSLRASCLLGLAPTAKDESLDTRARQAVIDLFHVDPEGTALAYASEPARTLAQTVRSSRVLLLHDRFVTARTGRPLRVRARLSGAPPGNAQVYLRYELEPDAVSPTAAWSTAASPTDAAAQSAAELADPDQYVRVLMDPQGGDVYEAYLRPGVGAVPAQGEHVLRYYLEASAADGALLDANGTAADPIRVQLSATQAEGAGVGGADAVIAALDEGGHVAHPPPPPPPGKPWYKRWAIIGPAGGALLVTGVVAALLLQPKPQAPSGTLGTEHLP